MNFKSTLLALTFFASTCQAASITIQLPATIEVQEVPAPRSRWGTYKTIITGTLVGGSMGAINYATDFLCPFNWIILSAMRNSVVNNIVDDARSQGESVNHSLFSDSAWISDWVAYILLLRNRNN